MMDVIMPGNGVDAVEAGTLVPVCQDEVADDSGGLDLDGGEGHAHLKSDPRLFRQHDYWPGTTHLSHEQFVELSIGRGLAFEVGDQAIPAAGMRLVAVGEPSPTNWAPPHWPRWEGRLRAHRCSPGVTNTDHRPGAIHAADFA